MKSRNIFRKILNGLSFTTVMFIFQACYGTPQDLENDLYIEGFVKSKTTGLPIKGIKVSVGNDAQHEYTDKQGYFGFYTLLNDSIKLEFEDTDFEENGSFETKDTLVVYSGTPVMLNIELNEK